MPPKTKRARSNLTPSANVWGTLFANLDIIGLMLDYVEPSVLGKFSLATKLIKSRSVAVFSQRCKALNFVAHPEVFKKVYSNSWEKLYLDRQEVKQAWTKFLVSNGVDPDEVENPEEQEFDGLKSCGLVLANLDRNRSLALENFFYWCPGTAQKTQKAFYKAQNGEDGDGGGDGEEPMDEEGEEDDERPANQLRCKTYNCDFSSLSWLHKEDVAEIILAPGKVEAGLSNCHCLDSLAERKDTTGEFHTEDCTQDLDGEAFSFVLRLWNGEFIRIMALPTNPRDYNGAAVWRSFKFEDLLVNVDPDDPMVR